MNHDTRPKPCPFSWPVGGDVIMTFPVPPREKSSARHPDLRDNKPAAPGVKAAQEGPAGLRNTRSPAGFFPINFKSRARRGGLLSWPEDRELPAVVWVGSDFAKEPFFLPMRLGRVVMKRRVLIDFRGKTYYGHHQNFLDVSSVLSGLKGSLPGERDDA
jgi:hypothetical protein